MKSDGRLIEDEDGIGLGFPHLAGKLQALGLAAGQTGSFFAQGQVSKAQIFKHLQPLPHQFQIFAGLKGPAYVHVHQFRQGIAFSFFIGVFYFFCVFRVS